MGGKLFGAERIPQKEYDFLKNLCAEKFSGIDHAVLFPESFQGKTDHGDLDVVIRGDALDNKRLMKMFDLRPEWVKRNSNVISIHWQGKYQIDLCFHPAKEFVTAYQYMRNGDCANLCGRIAHSLGFKLGHTGLTYPVNLSACEKIGEIDICGEMERSLEYFGLDAEQWKEGFNNQEELFEWVSKSKYFNPEIYKFENLNHVNRIRNKKRPVFAAFVEWLEGKEFPPIEKINKAESLFDSLVYFRRLSALNDIQSMLAQYVRKKEANAKFNGDLVREWSTLEGKVAPVEGKTLGAVLAAFRRIGGLEDEKDWTDWRIKISSERIKECFLDWFKKNRLTFLENSVE